MILDLLMMAEQAAASVWTPAQLFQNGEIGYWLDGSDLSTLFQDGAGATPVTASGQPVGLWKNKIAGDATYDVLQSTTSARPQYQVSGGKSKIVFDGANDTMLNSIAVGTMDAANGVTVCVGYSKPVAPGSTQRFFYANRNPTVVLSQRSAGEIEGELLGLSGVSTEKVSYTTPNVISLYGKGGAGATPMTINVNGAVTTHSIPNSITASIPYRLVDDSASGMVSFSQIVFINRLLTPTELTQLQTFIGSKQ